MPTRTPILFQVDCEDEFEEVGGECLTRKLLLRYAKCESDVVREVMKDLLAVLVENALGATSSGPLRMTEPGNHGMVDEKMTWQQQRGMETYVDDTFLWKELSDTSTLVVFHVDHTMQGYDTVRFTVSFTPDFCWFTVWSSPIGDEDFALVSNIQGSEFFACKSSGCHPEFSSPRLELVLQSWEWV